MDETSCCCSGPNCKNFPHQNMTQVPFIHIELDEPQESTSTSNSKTASSSTPRPVSTTKTPSKSTIQVSERLPEERPSDAQSHFLETTWSGFNWSLSTVEALIIMSVVAIIFIIVVAVGLWYIHEKTENSELPTITTVSESPMFENSDYGFEIKESGKVLF